LETLLAAHGKFREVIYDTQGIRDDGSDVVLRIPPVGGETTPRLICFQAKSFDDLTKNSYMQELKAQRDDTFRKVQGLDYYFLVLCTDMKAHQARVRNVMAEFKSAMLTEVIEPAYAYTFLNYPATRIDAFVKRTVEAEDLVFKDALSELGNYGPSAQALAIYIAVKSILTGESVFEQDELLDSAALRSIYGELRQKQALLLEAAAQNDRSSDDDEDDDWAEQWEEEPIQISEFQEQLATDLDIIESGVATQITGTQSIRFLAGQMRALSAIIADALARYEYQPDQLMNYMFDVMGIRD
jgi:hypothetical protein